MLLAPCSSSMDTFISFDFSFLLKKILFERQSYGVGSRARKRQNASVCWLAPEMPSAARSGSDWTRTRLNLDWPRGCQKAKVLICHLLSHWTCQQEDWVGSRIAGTETNTPTREAGVSSGSGTGYATLPVSSLDTSNRSKLCGQLVRKTSSQTRHALSSS